LLHWESKTSDRTFSLELKGLGSWKTTSNNIVLYADLSRESKEIVKTLAKEIRDAVVLYLKEIGWSLPDDDEDLEANEEDNFLEEKGGEEEEEGEEENNTPIFWIDNPRDEVYIPHVTIFNSDPKYDMKLRKRIDGKRGGRKKVKRGEKGGKGKGGKGKRYIQEEVEPFGWSFNLLKDTRKYYSNYSFGKQVVKCVELQTHYKTVAVIKLSGDEKGEKEVIESEVSEKYKDLLSV